MTSPVIQADSSDARNTASGAISLTRPSRPSGVFPARTAPVASLRPDELRHLSQAYGRIEEMAGLHQAIAATVDAYHRARNAGHPTVAIVVGQALSGGFLAHGLQAQQILALDDPGVQIHAMHKSAAARITLRTVDELEKLAETVVPLSYNVRDWAQLGLCDGLLPVSDADDPTADDVSAVRHAVDTAVAAARSGPRDLSNRLDSPGALTNRKASRAIRDVMSAQWQGTERP